MGADAVVDLSRGSLGDQAKALCPAGFDRVLITAPPRTLPDAVRVARFGGIIGLIGIEFGPGARVELDVNEFHFKKLQLRASHAIPDVRFPAILDALRDGSIDASLLVTHVFKLEESARALQVAASRDEPVIKVVVDCRS
jgi:L-iditol 2-dehydrogenase